MTRAAALLSALLLAATTLAQDPNWICVPGEDGRWRCGEGTTEPETSPLPALEETPAAAPPLVEPELVLPAMGAPAAAGARSGAFALKIASVSSLEELPAFVESYGLDPALIRHVEIDEAGTTRQLILWGVFVSPEQARRAVAGLPRVVRAMRPQMVDTDKFAKPARPMLGAPAQPPAVAAAGPKPEPIPAAQPPAVPAPDPSAEAPPSQPSAEAPAAPVVDAYPVEPVSPPVPAPDPSDEAPPPEPSAEAPAAPVVDAEPVEPLPPPAPDPGLTAAAAATPVAAPEPVPMDRPPRPAVLPEAPAVATPPGERGPPITASAPPGRGAAAFGELDATAYTVQLTSLREAALIERYLSRHRLEPARLYRIRVDEGAGPRWLLLWGAYPTLAEAEGGRDALPPSVRSPWVRRIGPLQQRLGLQSGR